MLAGDVNYVCTFHDSEDGFCEDGKSGKSWISKFMLIKMDVSEIWRYKIEIDLQRIRYMETMKNVGNITLIYIFIAGLELLYQLLK